MEKFERLSLFAAAYVHPHITLIQTQTGMYRINDNSVPYPTAAIETVDHFAQWQDQRLVVDYNDAGIIRSWSREQQDYTPKAKEKGGRLAGKGLGTYIGTLPPVLRYRFPFNYASSFPPLTKYEQTPQSDNMDEYQLILLLFPIMLPIVLCLMYAQAPSVQT